MIMGRFNLLDEPWIPVLDARSGEKEEVSVTNFFRHAEKYQALVGEMETQNFAVMRFLLSIVQTVFSRFDMEGHELPGVNLDDRWGQTDPVDGDDLDDYCEADSDNWDQMWTAGHFPEVIIQYLEKWKDRFCLFDENHPFFQISKREMDEIMADIPKKSQPTTIFGKNLNRTISESENKPALFSPIANIAVGRRSRRDILSEAELARWLLTFQGYAGLADKVSYVRADQRSSKGWLFDLGGIYLRGNNLFETILMNYIPESPAGRTDYSGRIQRPCWEAEGSDVIRRLYTSRSIDNLAELYTNWSRAIYIDPETDMAEPVRIEVVKLSEIEHTEESIEPMTLWKWNDAGPNKNHFTPKKHSFGQSLWRSFGIIALRSSAEGDEKRHQPGIFSQYERLRRAAGSRWTDLVGISMKDDGNATSWLPVDEITDSFRINDLVVTDSNPDGWIIRISDAVETTKEVVSIIFRSYLRGICEIRNTAGEPAAKLFLDEETAKMYEIIDYSFKEWLASIRPDDSREEAVRSWYSQLRGMVLERGRELFENSTSRDLTGIEKETGVENIATKYWMFVNRVYKKLGKGGGQS